MAHRNVEARLPNNWMTLDDANARAVRAFWRGLALGAALIGIVAGAVFVLGGVWA